ncbi:MAG TPA: glycosyltransferase family 2 protein [Kineosporiaceae bacterium]|nr:glycosyltransferase family 2 protein [Kineosporiaceae bacterium]
MSPGSQGPGARAAAWPPVSVVVPVLNEERHLEAAVTNVLEQDYPGSMEVVLAVGPSRDRTAAVAARLAAADPRVHIVENPTGRTPAGLNAAIKGSTGDVVVRVDAHSELSGGYVRRAVEILEHTGADNVGGLMLARGRTPFERAVACAMGSRFGIGGARFHVGGEEGEAETVYLGVFRRSTLDRLGGFDEHFHRAQDWELNHRIRSSGGTIWFSPELSVTYRPRSTWQALALQFFRTGRWRRQVTRRYPETASLRYLAPPITVVAMAAGTLAGLVGAVTGPGWLRLGWMVPGGYVAAVLIGSQVIAGRDEPADAGERAWLPVVVATMHLAWGAGFLVPLRRLGRHSPAVRRFKQKVRA